MLQFELLEGEFDLRMNRLGSRLFLKRNWNGFHLAGVLAGSIHDHQLGVRDSQIIFSIKGDGDGVVWMRRDVICRICNAEYGGLILIDHDLTARRLVVQQTMLTLKDRAKRHRLCEIEFPLIAGLRSQETIAFGVVALEFCRFQWDLGFESQNQSASR